MHKSRLQQPGFTIVELLVVIVIIGILAAVTIVSYTGISTRAVVASLQTDLSSAGQQLKMFSVDNGAYPATLSTDCNAQPDNSTNKCMSASSGNTYSYYSSDGTSYTLVDYGGNNTCISTDSTAPLCFPGKIFLSTEMGYYHACGVASDGQAYCWGYDSTGQLGNNSTTQSLVPVAVNTTGVLAGKTIKAVTAGSDHSCAIASDNQAYCWGNNANGQLGNNSTTQSLVPVAVNTTGVLAGKTIKSISAGLSFTCVIASDNQAYCWGHGTSGDLGNGLGTQSLVPVAVSTSGVLSGKTVKWISASGYYACVVASDSQAYCWGTDWNGQLGNNTSMTTSNVPVAVSTSGVLSGKTISAISAGDVAACAIASDSQAYCWGNDAQGQLGNNSTTQSTVPVAVNTSGVLSGKTIKTISAGYGHACAVSSDNLAYCWGGNPNGGLGNNSTTQSTVPVAVNTSGVLSGKAINKVSAVGFSASCALSSDYQAFCWGYNNRGQLGNNSTTQSLVPVAVQGP